LVLSPSSLRAFKLTEHFTPLRLPINEVFNAMKDKLWVRRPRLNWYNPTHPGAEEYYSYHDIRGHKTIHCYSLQKYLKEIIGKGFLKEYILTPKTAS